MAHAEREIRKAWPSVDADRTEDHAEAARWLGQVDLGAVGEHRPIVTLILYAPHVLKRNPALLVFAPGGFGGLAPCRRGAREVFGPGALIEVRGEAAPSGWRQWGYGSSSGGSMWGSCSAQNSADSSGVISRPPERSRIASQEVSGTSVSSPPARWSVTT